MAKISFEKLTIELADQLPSRTRDVLAGRFGLESPEPQTLESVGRQHQLTRERVRQIVQEGLRQLKEEKAAQHAESLNKAFSALQDALAGAGSIKREDLLLELLEAKEQANHVLFLLNLGDQFTNQRETQDFYPFWALKAEMVKKAQPLHQRLLSFFKKKKSPVPEPELLAFHGKDVVCYLEVSKFIEKSPEGAWGLKTWPEVNPRGMRDKAYLVLRKEGNPLHFTEVASLISKLQEALVFQKTKPVLSQTVHNELIKDPRFVLVGRGTYGLSDWGLVPGTVKDVMRSVLADNGKSMEKEKLVAEILNQRQVKESTIMLNLQDRQYFLRNQDGTYTLRI